MTRTLLQPPPVDRSRPAVETAPLRSASAPDDPTRHRSRPRGATWRLRQVTLWSRQLFVLLRSGTPLAGALSAVERQTTDKRWKIVLGDVRQRIDEGSTLASSMERHPDCFDAVACSLVAAGESSGQLDVMLDRLASLTRQQLRVRRTLIGAMIYPALLLGVATSVLVLMLAFVFPRFAELFDTLDAPLPPSTQVLIVISDLLRGQWWLFLGAAVAAVVGAYFFARSAAGRRTIDGWLLRLPLIGNVARSLGAARIARLLGTLVSSRVPTLEALVLSRNAAGNSHYVDLIRDAEAAVTEGEPLSAVLERSPLISPSLAEAVRHGEQSGQVGTVLQDMADFMDEENESLVRALSSVLEPVILIVLGIIVAFVSLSMFLPLFDLTSMT